MLILTRRIGETLMIGDDVSVTVLGVKANQVRLGINAPKEVPVHREEIYERVWGYAMAHGDRSVDVFVRKLRQKLRGGSPRWSYIHTHFGVGYRFAPEREDAVEAELDLIAGAGTTGTDDELDSALAG